MVQVAESSAKPAHLVLLTDVCALPSCMQDYNPTKRLEHGLKSLVRVIVGFTMLLWVKQPFELIQHLCWRVAELA